MVSLCLLALFTGCNGPGKNQPIWEHTKISDLAPAHRGKSSADRLNTITFNIHIFQMPAKNISTLEDVWQILYTNHLDFNNYPAFRANSFAVGFGQGRTWNKIADLLLDAKAKRIETITLLFSDRQTNDVAIATLYDEQTVFYTASDRSLESTALGPGVIALRIKAEKIPEAKGVCKFNALPVFLSPTASFIPQLATRGKSTEVLFTSCHFGAKMALGDFFFLGPKRYVAGQTTLDSLFFSRTDKDKPVLKTYLIVCSGITD